eukprot:scaffold6578_cov141-Skeletonema_marinoi.AAC.23
MFLHPFCYAAELVLSPESGQPVKCQRFNPQSQGVLSKLAGLAYCAAELHKCKQSLQDLGSISTLESVHHNEQVRNIGRSAEMLPARIWNWWSPASKDIKTHHISA